MCHRAIFMLITIIFDVVAVVVVVASPFDDCFERFYSVWSGHIFLPGPI